MVTPGTQAWEAPPGSARALLALSDHTTPEAVWQKSARPLGRLLEPPSTKASRPASCPVASVSSLLGDPCLMEVGRCGWWSTCRVHQSLCPHRGRESPPRHPHTHMGSSHTHLPSRPDQAGGRLYLRGWGSWVMASCPEVTQRRCPQGWAGATR